MLNLLSLIFSAPKAPTLNESRPHIAPNVTIAWMPRNLDVYLYYVTLTGPNVSLSFSTNETFSTFYELKPGTSYQFTVTQQTSGEFARNSSETILIIRTNSTGECSIIVVPYRVLQLSNPYVSISMNSTADAYNVLLHNLFRTRSTSGC